MEKKLKNFIKDLKKDGFIIVPNLISKNKCEKFKKILNKDYEKYQNNYYIEKKRV